MMAGQLRWKNLEVNTCLACESPVAWQIQISAILVAEAAQTAAPFASLGAELYGPERMSPAARKMRHFDAGFT